MPTLGTEYIAASVVRERIQVLGANIAKDYANRIPHMLCVLKGAVIFHADLIRAMDIQLTVGFVLASSYADDTASSGRVKITADLVQVAGRDVVIVEDIVDTGLTVFQLYYALCEAKARSVAIATLLDKPSRRVKKVPLDYVGFEIADEFVVGYGLDYAQHFRNVPGIHKLDIS
jgi:hypoxanthine phosphoribosyltransferase